MRGHREYAPGEYDEPPDFVFPPELRQPIVEALDVGPEKAEEALSRVEEACGYVHLQRFLQTSAPAAAEIRDALRTSGELARRLREEIDSLEATMADHLALRVAEATPRRLKLGIPDGLGAARIYLDDLRAELAAIERAPSLPMPRGRRPDAANRLAVHLLGRIWTEATGRAATVSVDPTALEGSQETGPFADFVRLCFKAIDPDLDPPTLRHYLP